MKKTTHMLLLEARSGRSIEDLIQEAVSREGSVPKAAEALGITRAALNRWIKGLEGRVHTGTAVVFDAKPHRNGAATLAGAGAEVAA